LERSRLLLFEHHLAERGCRRGYTKSSGLLKHSEVSMIPTTQLCTVPSRYRQERGRKMQSSPRKRISPHRTDYRTAGTRMLLYCTYCKYTVPYCLPCMQTGSCMQPAACRRTRLPLFLRNTLRTYVVVGCWLRHCIKPEEHLVKRSAF
jgi:hypothetical protein